MQDSFEKIISEIVKTSRDMWSKGWAEANAGNISLRLRPEIAQDKTTFQPRSDWVALDMKFPNLAKERFLITGTGMYLRNIEISPANNVGVIELDDSGGQYRLLWGYESGCDPTSELSSHLEAQAVRKRVTDGTDRAVIHTHSPNLTALTYALDLDTLRISKLLWEMHTECIIIFPEGVEFVPWMLPGSLELAEATAKGLEKRRVILWQFHGILATGNNLDAAFGLIDTAEKAAGIYLKAASAGPISNKLSTEQLQALARRFALKPDPSILNTRI